MKTQPAQTRNLLLACSLVLFAACTKNLAESRDLTNKPLLASTAQTNHNYQGMKLIVPAYFSDEAKWDSLTAQADLYPEGMIYAIINVWDGPYTHIDTALLRKITRFRDAGGKILGYTNTWNYPQQIKVPIDTVKQDVDRWYDWYGEQMDGIFYDQMYPWNGGEEAFYRALYVYAKAQDPQALVVGNPGGWTSETYVNWNGNRVTDVICTFEREFSKMSDWASQPWWANYTRDRYYYLIHTAPTAANMQVALQFAIDNNYGWFFCTSGLMPNPWDTLPPYLAELCAAVHDAY